MTSIGGKYGSLLGRGGIAREHFQVLLNSKNKNTRFDSSCCKWANKYILNELHPCSVYPNLIKTHEFV